MRSARSLLTKYAAYHRDQRNIVTHFFGVPMIVFAVGVLLARPAVAINGYTITLAAVGFAVAAAWYLSRGAVLGLATSLFVGLLVLLSHAVAGGSVASWLSWGLGFFVVGWLIQFIGHYYEGRKPASIDDLASLLVAPMFIVAEWLFMLGWNKPLQSSIEAEVGPTHLRDLAHPA
jgi:uncharacterized membrane protein YGL010W